VSASQVKETRRAIRRALGPKALGALAESQQNMAKLAHSQRVLQTIISEFDRRLTVLENK
jgi:hypothetical protein